VTGTTVVVEPAIAVPAMRIPTRSVILRDGATARLTVMERNVARTVAAVVVDHVPVLMSV